MRIIIAGGHGKIALRLAARLKSGAVGIVRNPAHVADVEATGAEAVLCDLERASVEEVTRIVEGADAVVFAAGAGPGSGAARKDTVDRGASVLLADAAERAGVRRFIQISSMGAGKPPAPGRDEVWAAYIRAKTEAEEDLRARDLAWTILRPGRLTDEPGTGLVRLAPEVPPGAVPRDDVAAVIMALLENPGTARRTLELVSGDTPIIDLVATE
ncbi:oxidoreductase ylbE [[Actinomadura] parvosata subsp. kistnae]|uniref:NAD-dependent dehydratase n=1 Tax=[Actinomadura] parvosata subsp. kistnae TaxID=1909395 RepID=A0A1V0A1U0_9ACTN|nr:SDR family oxidoreductase [Nonomuraea sp. ATCC 55076]AQZ64186.1 NAD-dependent dehydratase [Nonomuraea sp. ATCC 55076]SPM00003.1 oxidoreductase ylbE [Actinomadura parvosata subsp. kistnae]